MRDRETGEDCSGHVAFELSLKRRMERPYYSLGRARGLVGRGLLPLKNRMEISENPGRKWQELGWREQQEADFSGACSPS